LTDFPRKPKKGQRKQVAISQLAEILPAHSIEAEQSLLGAMLIDCDIAIKYANEFNVVHFYRENHQVIFAAACALVKQGQPLDIVTLPEYLKSSGDLAEVGGIAYILSLFDALPSTANHAYYAKIVQEKATLRRITAAGLELVALGQQEDAVLTEIVSEAELTTANLRDSAVRTTGITLVDTIKEFEANWANPQVGQGSAMGAMSGLSVYDEYTNGLQRNKLIVIAGRPGMGKSSALLTLGIGAAVLTRRPTLIMSAEMEADELWVRIACSIAHVDSRVVERGEMSTAEWERYEQAKDFLKDAPIYIDQRKRPSPSYVRSVARRVMSLYGDLGFIGVDYLQLMQADRETDNRTQDLGRIAYDLKDMSGELSVPIVALAQLNRSVESREDKRPILSDIRASGEIEEAADIIVGLYCEEYYKSKGIIGLDPGRTQEAELIFLKQRKGPTGTVKCGFIGQYTKFFDLPVESGYASGNDYPTGF
jgi:replicative DNA helicase